MHYSLAQSPDELNTWTRGITNLLCKYVRKHSITPVFVYRGYSGAATATALACAIAGQRPNKRFTFHLCYIRKTTEQSHGDRYERNVVPFLSFSGKEEVYFLVDDFAESGDTLLELVKAVREVYSGDFKAEDFRALFTGPSGYAQADNADKYMRILGMDDIMPLDHSDDFQERLQSVLTAS